MRGKKKEILIRHLCSLEGHREVFCRGLTKSRAITSFECSEQYTFRQHAAPLPGAHPAPHVLAGSDVSADVTR